MQDSKFPCHTYVHFSRLKLWQTSVNSAWFSAARSILLIVIPPPFLLKCHDTEGEEEAGAHFLCKSTQPSPERRRCSCTDESTLASMKQQAKPSLAQQERSCGTKTDLNLWLIDLGRVTPPCKNLDAIRSLGGKKNKNKKTGSVLLCWDYIVCVCVFFFFLSVYLEFDHKGLTCLFFDFTENTEERWFHSVTVQSMFPVSV